MKFMEVTEFQSESQNSNSSSNSFSLVRAGSLFAKFYATPNLEILNSDSYWTSTRKFNSMTVDS